MDEAPRDDRTQLYESGFKPFVVEKNELAVQQFKMSRVNKAGDLAVPIAPFNAKSRKFTVVMCFDVDASTPSNASVSSYRIVRGWEVTRNEKGKLDVLPSMKVDSRDPIKLYRRTGTIFSF